ncbi:phospholipase-like protein [Tanacetum coccineum]
MYTLSTCLPDIQAFMITGLEELLSLKIGGNVISLHLEIGSSNYFPLVVVESFLLIMRMGASAGTASLSPFFDSPYWVSEAFLFPFFIPFTRISLGLLDMLKNNPWLEPRFPFDHLELHWLPLLLLRSKCKFSPSDPWLIMGLRLVEVEARWVSGVFLGVMEVNVEVVMGGNSLGPGIGVNVEKRDGGIISLSFCHARKVPRVLVTCRRRQIDDENDDDENVPLYYHINKDFSIPFGKEEFCLVTGLRFGVQNWAEYDTKQRRVFLFRSTGVSVSLDGQPITGTDIANMIVDQSFAQLCDDDAVSLCCLGILQLVILGVDSRRVVPEWMLRLANDRVVWNKYPWGSYVWPTLYSQLRNADVKRWSPLYVAQPINEDDAKTYSIFGYTWAFKILESFRVTAIRHFDRYNRYPRVAAWRNECSPVRQENKEPIIVEQHYGLTNFSQFQSMQGGPSSFRGHVPSHMGRPNLQTTIETHHDVDDIFDQNILNRGKREQFPSKYKLTPFMEQPPTIILPKQRVNKTKNKGKKANLSPLNLGGAFEDDNVEENNVTFLGSQFTGAGGNSVNLQAFLNELSAEFTWIVI